MAECTDCCLLQTSDRASTGSQERRSGNIRGPGLLLISNRACSSRENVEMYKYCLLRISNRACEHAENAEMCKTVAYYKYQIALEAVRKTQESTNHDLL